MGDAGREMDSVVSGIGRFDADHFLPVIGGHGGHAFGFVDPWIPDNGAVGAVLLDDYAAVPHRVMYDATGLGSKVHLISFFGDPQGLVAQLLAFESVGLVNVGSSFESGNGDPTNVGDSQISMQRLFVDEWFLTIVASLKLYFQRGADGH